MLANKAVMVNLNISQWTGRKHDRIATETVETEHKTNGKVGNYHKKLLPGAEELAEIGTLATRIRAYVYENTLPWCTDGARIIKATAILDFTNEFRKLKGEFDNAVSRFIVQYPDLRDQARAKLGTLFRETEYPTVQRLEKAFACDVSLMPVPCVDDFRVEIDAVEKAAFEKRMAEVEANAKRECWTRLYDVVSKAANRLSDPEYKIRESLIENVNDICGLLPNLNVMDDPELERMRQEVEKITASISTDDCRKNQAARDVAAKQLDDITSKMSAFMG
jgi:hypothetical protein